MSGKEIIYRIYQIFSLKKDYLQYFKKGLPVTKIKMASDLLVLKPKVNAIGLNDHVENIQVSNKLTIFNGAFFYEEYKKEWNAGFQTKNFWPLDQFTYDIQIAGRTDIGDIRTNWEINRHFQFVILAKNYYVTKEEKYWQELQDLFYDWNQHCLFLHGVEWYSAMEIAIRLNSWVFAYVFLDKANKINGSPSVENVLSDLQNGILVMAKYIEKHLSKYSSANNHLIIELYALGLVGFFTDCKKWIEFSIRKLSIELVKQNYNDGVNKEMSTHYQCFIMEAYGLMMLFMKKNKITVPDKWIIYLTKMSEFIADSCGECGETIVFGDDDDGKLLSTTGYVFNYYHYVLDLMSLVLPIRYSELKDLNENLRWLFNNDDIKKSQAKVLYSHSSAKCYRYGGYSFIRDKQNCILIGIDHADLGYGSIAAHGHADALSFQMYVKGNPVFVDAGTYNYHITPESRNDYRSTYNHNTITVNKKNQSEILGAFLWGHQASCNLIDFTNKDNQTIVEATVNYLGITHNRKYIYENLELIIEDKVDGNEGQDIFVVFLLPDNAEVTLHKGHVGIKINDLSIIVQSDFKPCIDKYYYSQCYNHQIESKRLSFIGRESYCRTNIKILI